MGEASSLKLGYSDSAYPFVRMPTKSVLDSKSYTMRFISTSASAFATLALSQFIQSTFSQRYGVYFEKNGPFPNGDNTPVEGSRTSDAKRPERWSSVDFVSALRIQSAL